MAIKIPNLDIRTFTELSSELVNEIPKFSRNWNDFNFSDPGITILEMLTWVVETLTYRANRIPNNTYKDFLFLLGGASQDEIRQQLDRVGVLDPDYADFLQYLLKISREPNPDIGQMRLAAVSFFKAPYLAITQHDFDLLVMQSNQIIPQGELRVAGVFTCQEGEMAIVNIFPGLPDLGVKRRTTNLYLELDEPETEGSQFFFQRSRRTMTFFNQYLNPINLLLDHVRLWLEPRTLLGTAVQVQLAEFSVVDLSLDLMVDFGLNLELKAAEIEMHIFRWLDPISGGPGGRGWPVDRLPQSSDLVSKVLAMPGVIRVLKAEIKLPLDTAHLNAQIRIPQRGLFRGAVAPCLSLNLQKRQSRNKGGRR